MTMRDTIETRLKEAFSPQLIEVVDESEQHRGHAGYREGGQSHFRVKIRAAHFDGLNRVAQQRAIFGVLEAEMAERIHALALDVGGVG
ncbi:MAG: BolA family transcriptional regulator [Rhodobacteraceae bacterium]|nr:BolA family transcriptional regulator [Paracoccaceae bacterium]